MTINEQMLVPLDALYFSYLGFTIFCSKTVATCRSFEIVIIMCISFIMNRVWGLQDTLLRYRQVYMLLVFSVRVVWKSPVVLASIIWLFGLSMSYSIFGCSHS